MDYTIEYKNIKNGYVRIGRDGILKLTIPYFLRFSNKFKNSLLEKGKILLSRYEDNIKVKTDYSDCVFGVKNELNYSEVELKNIFYIKCVYYLDKYSDLIGVKYNGLTIRHYKSKWGSCSFDNKIALNLKLVHLDEKFLEYVVIHELCHIIHKNHSKEFWKLVLSFCKDYTKLRIELKKLRII